MVPPSTRYVVLVALDICLGDNSPMHALEQGSFILDSTYMYVSRSVWCCGFFFLHIQHGISRKILPPYPKLGELVTPFSL
jgi:hypothetical protein